jgi:hypothetical protein
MKCLGKTPVVVAGRCHRIRARTHFGNEPAVLAYLAVHECVEILLDERPKLAQERGATRRRRPRPPIRIESAACGTDGAINVGCIGRRHTTPGLLGVGIQARECLAGVTANPFAVDEHGEVAIDILAGLAQVGLGSARCRRSLGIHFFTRSGRDGLYDTDGAAHRVSTPQAQG